jgi:predicted 3-demethylubiquinone-9 3-methyltransferase (glyoxalase superfamily)
MKKINPFLWFDSAAEQAAKFYVGTFMNSKIGRITRCGEDGPQPKGSVMTVEFTLDRVDFVALNGGPQFKFTEAISFSVNCETRMRSIISGRNFPPTADRLGGAAGSKTNSVSRGKSTRSFWAILLADPDAGKVNRVMKAIMEMDKIDIDALERAAKG